MSHDRFKYWISQEVVLAPVMSRLLLLQDLLHLVVPGGIKVQGISVARLICDRV
jgi:hypothetical protein